MRTKAISAKTHMEQAPRESVEKKATEQNDYQLHQKTSLQTNQQQIFFLNGLVIPVKTHEATVAWNHFFYLAFYRTH
jgi:hypothetical protein